MSESMKRRNSSRQMLQNLIRVTAQRSQEDAEEVERERRRRARERQRGEEGLPWPDSPPHRELTHRAECEEDLKPSRCRPVLDEDEGFSDWSHRLDHRSDREVQTDSRGRKSRASRPPEPLEEKVKAEEEREEQEFSRRPQGDAERRTPEKTFFDRKEGRTSFSSSVFVSQDARQHQTRTPSDRTSSLATQTNIRTRGGGCRPDEEQQEEAGEEQLTMQKERRSTQSRRTPREEEEEEEMSFTHEEVQEEKEEEEEEVIHPRREQRHKQQEEEEDKPQNKGRGRRREEEDPAWDFSVCSSLEGDEQLNCYGPMSPTFKKLLIQFYPEEVNGRVSTDGKCTIIERTESLRKSTSSTKKTPPPAPISKIDKRLEQYTHALEISSKEGRSGTPAISDLMSPSEPVASKKNLFEAREAVNQNNVSVTPSKDGSSGKRYKFVVTGHGKYEKVSVDHSCGVNANYQLAEDLYEDL